MNTNKVNLIALEHKLDSQIEVLEEMKGQMTKAIDFKISNLIRYRENIIEESKALKSRGSE